jgi:SAM-dependent methyltransferase
MNQQHTFALEFLQVLPLDELQGANVLDVGAGPGYQTQWLREHGVDACAVDLVKPEVDVPFIKCDTHELRTMMVDNRVDVNAIWSHHALEHMSNHLDVLQQFHDVLHTGGWLFLTVPQIDDTISEGHIVSFTMPLLVYQLAMIGFDMPTAKWGKFRSHLRVAVRKTKPPKNRTLKGLAKAKRLPPAACAAVLDTGRFNASHVPNNWFTM